MNNDAISKKALLEWASNRKEMHRTSMTYDIGICHMCDSLAAEIISGRFDLPSPAEGDTPQPIRDATEEEKFIRRITCSNDTLRGQLRESKATEGRYRMAVEAARKEIDLWNDPKRALTVIKTILDEALSPIGEQISLRPEIQWFAEQMELKLRANDHKGGWQDMNHWELIERLEEETTELKQLEGPDSTINNVIRESADVANFAMMIADNARRLIGEQKEYTEKPSLLESANCIVCGKSIDPELAILNTGRPDCCDTCAIERRSEYEERSKEDKER